MTLLIRSATLQDSPAMAALEASAVAHAWSDRQYAESIENHRCRLLEDNGLLVGLLVYSRVVDEVELLNIVVDPARRGGGLGKRLMQLLLEENRGRARQIFLEVRESNASAIGLYRAAGFAVQGVRKHYYPSGEGREDALIMRYDYR